MLFLRNKREIKTFSYERICLQQIKKNGQRNFSKVRKKKVIKGEILEHQEGKVKEIGSVVNKIDIPFSF
jgi:hypothetical protein